MTTVAVITIAVITTLNGAPEYYAGTYTLAMRPRDKDDYGIGLQQGHQHALSSAPAYWFSSSSSS